MCIYIYISHLLHKIRSARLASVARRSVSELMVTAMARQHAVEATRVCLMAAHAASGLAGDAEALSALRLIRAAEGLLRAAVAELVTLAPTTPTPTPTAPSTARPRRRRRRGGARGKGGGEVAGEGSSEAQQTERDEIVMEVDVVKVIHPVFVAAEGSGARSSAGSGPGMIWDAGKRARPGGDGGGGVGRPPGDAVAADIALIRQLVPLSVGKGVNVEQVIDEAVSRLHMGEGRKKVLAWASTLGTFDGD
jgi:hypothetical protein